MELNKLIALVVKLDVDVVFCINNIFSNLLNVPKKNYLMIRIGIIYSPLAKQNEASIKSNETAIIYYEIQRNWTRLSIFTSLLHYKQEKPSGLW
jgi:hypothetical protein